jgi:putative ABC transport system permease protein
MPALSHALRALRRRPWYTASLITAIATGCALLATVLIVVDGVLFKPLGYPDSSQLVDIRVSSPRSRIPPEVGLAEVARWGQSAPGVAFTAFRVSATADEWKWCAYVQPNFFDVIGVRPALGSFAPQDFTSRHPTIEPRIVTHEYFQSRAGGDPGAIGRTVITDAPRIGFGYRIVGVMPPGFIFPSDRGPVSYLVPNAGFIRAGFDIVARVPPELTRNEVRFRILASAAASRSPGIDEVDIQPLRRALGATLRPLFAAFLVGAGLLVAVAAINAASLMAGRSLDRRQELVVRRALGATSIDIGRLLLVETALVVTAGSVAGLALAVPLTQVTVPMLPDGRALFRSAEVDGRVMAFIAIVAVVITGVVTMFLLRQVMRGDTNLAQGRSVTERTRATGRRLVITVQVALALVLALAGSLLVGSLLSVYSQVQPIAMKSVVTIKARVLGGPTINTLASVPGRVARVSALLERLRAVPGVDAVAATAANDLLRGGYTSSGFGPPPTASQTRMVVQQQAVTSDYYRVIRPEIVAGRLPLGTEWASNDPVVVVSERVARHYWPNASAPGQTLTYDFRDGRPRLTFTVVGVVKDVRWSYWDEAEVPTVYGPYALVAKLEWPTFLIHTSADTAQVTADALRVISEVDPLMRPQQVALLGELFADSVRSRRLQAWLFGSFTVASLFVVGIGIFGQLAMSTARRTREVGIRIACGASRRRIAGLILFEQLGPVVAGLVIGGIVAVWGVRFVGSYLYQLSSFDARAWAAAIGLILLAAAAGTLVPALRASRIDPTQALRAE